MSGEHEVLVASTPWRDVARFARFGRSDLISVLRDRLRAVHVPAFEVQLADGSTHRLAGAARREDSGREDAHFKLVVKNERGAAALATLDELQIGEAYVAGDFDIEGDFLSCLDLRQIFTNRRPIRSALRFLVPLVLGQRRSDLAWVPHHYDFGNEFYFAFLDKWVGLYSQALYTSDDEPLEQAVRNKLDYIVEICRLRRDSHVLNVGGGWGALEKYFGAQGIHSTMLTISHQQFRHLADWCRQHTLPCRLNVVRESIFAYEPKEQYDAIVLLGVMEHLPDYRKLFGRFRQLLKAGARVYMDFAAARKKFDVSAFTYRYVFPGNHTPVYLPGLFEAAVRHGFEPIALHNDRHSYYLTLQAWARNLETVREQAVALVGEQAYRLFRLYLWGGAQQLQRNGSLESYRVVFQRSAGRPSSEIGCYRPL